MAFRFRLLISSVVIVRKTNSLLHLLGTCRRSSKQKVQLWFLCSGSLVLQRNNSLFNYDDTLAECVLVSEARKDEWRIQYERVILHKCPPPLFISREKSCSKHHCYCTLCEDFVSRSLVIREFYNKITLTLHFLLIAICC